MLTAAEAKAFRAALDEARNPVFIFHDDPDGLASFLLCRRYTGEGGGIPIKALPDVTPQYAPKVAELGGDAVFILDVAMVEQDFIDAVKVPVHWLDHHTPLARERVRYYNPRKSTGENVPTPALVWQALAGDRPVDIWIATVGAIGDWYWPPYVEEFRRQYPDLLPASATDIRSALFSSPVGTLVKAFSFCLKGKTTEVKRLVQSLLKVDSPYEILRQETPEGRLVWRKYEAVNALYEDLLGRASAAYRADDPLLVYTYTEDELSLTRDVSNELLHRFPDKVVVLGREKSGELRCSLRSAGAVRVDTALVRALVGIPGARGGGHEHACGCSVPREDFTRFLDNLRKALAGKV
jgi:hypothetical protein